ncbi:hypothetical protein ACFXPT_22925 [Streptomyces goshikiensis]|uniref:hypothetical protein n=1 Tax=Streptomyces goshikiensis TaxID=1942 RepID=UPI0036C5C3B3
MQTTISTRVESGSFFDLDRKEQALIRLREEGAEWALPFALMEHLVKSGTPYVEHARALSSDRVHVSGATFDWFDAELPEQIAREISLADYEIVEHTDGRRAALTQALERLAAAHPEGFARVREFVRGLLWVGLKPTVRASSLTSSSDPALPYVIAFSEKARHHIPPEPCQSGAVPPLPCGKPPARGGPPVGQLPRPPTPGLRRRVLLEDLPQDRDRVARYPGGGPQPVLGG